MSRVSWSVRLALVPAGAALVALAALPGVAAASVARPAMVAAATTNAAPAAIAAPASLARASLSHYQTYGTQQGAVRGPGGPGGAGPQIWLIALDPPNMQGNPAGSQVLDEVSPASGKVDYWGSLPPYVGNDNTLLAYDDGPPAFDGSGNAWIIASSTKLSGTVSHYLVRYTPGPSSRRFYKLASSCSSPHDITAAGNGVVWLACNSAKAIRVTSSGAMRTFGLSRVATLGSLAAGPGGAMWAVGYNSSHSATGLVRLTSSGGEAYYGTPRGITARGVTGDGSSRVIETAGCGSSVCFESVSSSGRLSHVGTAPGRVTGSSGPSMDTGGNVWLLVRGSAAGTGQYFLKLTSGNRTQAYQFSVPGCSTLLSIAGNPAATTDRSAWAESVTNCTFIGNTQSAYVGGLVRLRA